jgi:hypothetical protein
MGLFVSMSGVVGANEDEVAAALDRYADAHSGSLEPEELTSNDDGCLVLSEGLGGVTVLYPGDFLGWDDASSYLSRELNRPTFSLHIQDGDLWMYLLFDRGQIVDQFNPLPDYWQELDDAERQTWRGNAVEVAKRVPGLSPDTISKYLVPWSDDILEADEIKRAYASDQHGYGSDWQLLDFMAKLGLDYPVDDRGVPHGATYRFLCPSK